MIKLPDLQKGIVPSADDSGDVNLPKVNEVPVEKMMSDLKGGFRVTMQYIDATVSFVTVVTKSGDDLFIVKAEVGHLPEHPFSDAYTRVLCEVRRKKDIALGKSSATLERWNINKSTVQQDGESFRTQKDKGGELDEHEFWKRYRESSVNPETTAKFLEINRDDPHHEGAEIHWVSEESLADKKASIIATIEKAIAKKIT